MLATTIAFHGYYVPHALDLTCSTQKRADVSTHHDGPSPLPYFLRADMRFVWNRFEAQKLGYLGSVSSAVPIIFGYIDMRRGILKGKSVQLVLISRRSADSPDLHFTARGADVHDTVVTLLKPNRL